MAHAIQPHLSSLPHSILPGDEKFWCARSSFLQSCWPYHHFPATTTSWYWYFGYVMVCPVCLPIHVANVFACMRIHTASSQLLPLPNAPQCTPPFDATRPPEQNYQNGQGARLNSWLALKSDQWSFYMQDITPCPENPQGVLASRFSCVWSPRAWMPAAQQWQTLCGRQVQPSRSVSVSCSRSLSLSLVFSS